LNQLALGIKIDEKITASLFYAVDIVLLSPTEINLQKTVYTIGVLNGDYL